MNQTKITTNLLTLNTNIINWHIEQKISGQEEIPTETGSYDHSLSLVYRKRTSSRTELQHIEIPCPEK